MIQDNTLIKVTNRDTGVVGYSIPDLGITRQYQPRETKKVTFEELRKLTYVPGGQFTLNNLLIVHDPEALAELCPNVEPEYFYDEEAIKKLLLEGSINQLKDCLDFAPDGVIELVKDLAVKMRLNDLSKREIITKATGFNVSRAIQINEESAEVEAVPTERKARRADPITTGGDEVKTRRTEPPKYNVITKAE